MAGKVGGEEAAVGADRVAAERDRARLGGVGADEVERRRPGVGEGDVRGSDGFEQAGAVVHLDDERVHAGEHLVGLVDDEVGPLGDDGPARRRSRRGDLDDDVARVVEPGHLQVHPHEHGRDTTEAATALVPDRCHDGRRARQHQDGVRASARPARRRRARRAPWSLRVHGLPRWGAGATHRPHRHGGGRGGGRLRVHRHAPTARSPTLPVDGRPSRAIGGARRVLRPRRRRRHGPRVRPRRHVHVAAARWAQPRLAEMLGRELDAGAAGYQVVTDLPAIPRELRGLHPTNPVNVPPGGGVQLELPPRVRGLGPRWADWDGDGLVPPAAALVERAGAGRRHVGRTGVRRASAGAVVVIVLAACSGDGRAAETLEPLPIEGGTAATAPRPIDAADTESTERSCGRVTHAHARARPTATGRRVGRCPVRRRRHRHRQRARMGT